MTFTTNNIMYRKDLLYPTLNKSGIGRGYSKRPADAKIQSIVIHTTNGHIGSTFAQEATFLRDTNLVSAHTLVSKTGDVATILPDNLMAWHAGICVKGYQNEISLGVEQHFTLGEPISQAQIDGLTRLVRGWMHAYNIPISRVQAHRTIALPLGRKIDPSNFNEAGFTSWVNGLDDCDCGEFEHPMIMVQAASPDGELNIRQGPGRSFPIAGVLKNTDPPIACDALISGEDVDHHNSGWYHLDDERGFIWSGYVTVRA